MASAKREPRASRSKPYIDREAHLTYEVDIWLGGTSRPYIWVTLVCQGNSQVTHKMAFLVQY